MFIIFCVEKEREIRKNAEIRKKRKNGLSYLTERKKEILKDNAFKEEKVIMQPTKSFWTEQARKWSTNDELPSKSRVVVIGSVGGVRRKL